MPDNIYDWYYSNRFGELKPQGQSIVVVSALFCAQCGYLSPQENSDFAECLLCGQKETITVNIW